MVAKTGSCHFSPGGGSAACTRARTGAPEEERSEALATRHMPRRSALAVFTMSTRESGSSIQSTGTSWIRSPERSASSRSSVSKNHSSSCTRGSSACTTSVLAALKPHCASENRAAIVVRSRKL